MLENDIEFPKSNTKSIWDIWLDKYITKQASEDKLTLALATFVQRYQQKFV